MDRVELEAEIRKEVGKGPSRRLRQEGALPGVVYSPRMNPLPIALSPLDIRRVLASGENVLVNLKIKDGRKVQKKLVMIKDYQVHPLKEFLWHVDFYEISLKESVEVEVPLVFTGEAEGVKAGGILSPLLRTVLVSCLPEQIPEHLEVDCSALSIGDTLHVSDLTLPAKVEVRTDPETAMVTVSPPEAEIVPEVAEEEAELEEAAAEEEAPSEEESEE
jgi:large subunit ribosomal protein L25